MKQGRPNKAGGPFYNRFLPLLGFDLKHRSEALLERHEKHVVSYEHPRLGLAITSPRSTFAGERYGCSAASYHANGHQIVGRNFDLPSDRPHYFVNLQMTGTYKVMGHTVYDITGEVVDASPILGNRPLFSGT